MTLWLGLAALLLLSGRGGAAPVTPVPYTPGVPTPPAPSAPPLPLPGNIDIPGPTDPTPVRPFINPLVEPTVQMEEPRYPESNASYETWRAYFEQLLLVYQHNYRLAVEEADRSGQPRPQYVAPYNEEERMAKLNAAQPVWSGYVYTDAEIQAYADKYGLSFLSAKTAIAQGMFLG